MKMSNSKIFNLQALCQIPFINFCQKLAEIKVFQLTKGVEILLLRLHNFSFINFFWKHAEIKVFKLPRAKFPESQIGSFYLFAIAPRNFGRFFFPGFPGFIFAFYRFLPNFIFYLHNLFFSFLLFFFPLLFFYNYFYDYFYLFVIYFWLIN